MSGAQAKTINLLLYDGELSGVISIEDSSWNSGELYSAPRDSVNDLLKTDACNKFGVYLLLSKDMVYVGQASDLAKRITQHVVGKDWWESVVILTTKDDSLNHADIDYLEAVLIDKANQIGKLDVDNKNKGNKLKVDTFRKVYLGQYLDEALFLMQLIGITVFSCNKTTTGPLINTIDVKTKLAIGKRAKTEAVDFLESKGITLGKNVTYAVKNNKNEFWANPRKRILDEDWWLVLNDNEKYELIVLMIPGKKYKIADFHEGKGFYIRSDKPEQLDIFINAETLCERKSSLNLREFLVKKMSYK